MFSVKGGGSNKKLYSDHKKLYTLQGVPDTPRYKKLYKVKIDKQDMAQIQQRLDLEAHSHRTFKARVKMNDFYLDCNYNPFSDPNGKAKERLLKMNEEERKKIVNIVDRAEIKDVGNDQKKTVRIKNQRENLKEMIVDFQLKSKKLINKVQRSKTDQQNKLITSQFQNLPNKKISYEEQTAKNQNKNYMDIDDIMQIKDSNYFMNQMAKLNIFKIVRDQNICISAFDYLRSKNFNFNAVVQKNYLFKTSIYRQLSRMGRNLLSKHNHQPQLSPQEYLNSHEFKGNIKYLFFQDILNFATNRISPQTAGKLFEHKNVNSDNKSYSSSSQEEQEQGFRERLLENNGLSDWEGDFKGESQQQQQNTYYKQLGYLEKQQKMARKIEIKLTKLQQVYRVQSQAYENQINDKKIHNRLSQTAKQGIMRILSEENKYHYDTQPMEKTVRQRKAQTNKSQTIKLKNFTSMLKEKNRAMKVNSQLSRKRS